MTLLDRSIVRVLPLVPRPVVRLVSSRYIAGAELAEAVATVRELNAQGKHATIDVLGEEIGSEAETHAFARDYEDVLAAIEREALQSGISVKLTALGLELDEELCRQNLVNVVAAAAEHHRFVRIDMEDATTTDATLRSYRGLRDEGHDNVGIVLQASLRRTVDDVHALADLKPSVRLCKGIYVESPDIQYRDPDEVRFAFVRALEALLDAGCHVGIATHDDALLAEGKRLVAEHGLGREEYEFQMLLGVKPEVATQLVRDGHKVRVYVPFGSHWYEYSVRRLQENPSIAGYIASDTVGRFFGARRNGS